MLVRYPRCCCISRTTWPALGPAPPPLAPRIHPPRCSPYLLDHLGESVPVAMVASHCGIGRRRLQACSRTGAGVRRCSGCAARLRTVNEALMIQANGDHKDWARPRAFGFTHLGEFSRAYRQAFRRERRSRRAAAEARSGFYAARNVRPQPGTTGA